MSSLHYSSSPSLLLLSITLWWLLPPVHCQGGQGTRVPIPPPHEATLISLGTTKHQTPDGSPPPPGPFFPSLCVLRR
jgi:hypothetical protein